MADLYCSMASAATYRVPTAAIPTYRIQDVSACARVEGWMKGQLGWKCSKYNCMKALNVEKGKNASVDPPSNP
ncbi:hypothetical protein H9L39_14688 [Fusarium oxysporum f. sp. albedinis]|nr:hypothetical protein H9L39_14688 [Fusarium oxysporum f. sp. albedinis]